MQNGSLHWTEEKPEAQNTDLFISIFLKNKKDHIKCLPFVLQLVLSCHHTDGPRGRCLLMQQRIEFSLLENNIYYTQANVWPKGMKTGNIF